MNTKLLRNFVKTLVMFFILINLFVFFPIKSFSHPGGTDSDGCHYCRTNCNKWGVAYNQRHCHNGSSSSKKSHKKKSLSSKNNIKCKNVKIYFQGNFISNTITDKNCNFLFPIKKANNIFNVSNNGNYLTISYKETKINFKNKSKKVKLFKNQSTYSESLNTFPKIINKSFYVPVRFLFETCGYTVNYDNTNDKIYIQ